MPKLRTARENARLETGSQRGRNSHHIGVLEVLESRPNGLMCCKHSKGKRLRNHDCACTDLQLPSQQIDDVDNGQRGHVLALRHGIAG